MGSWLVTWFISSSKDDASADSVRLDNVTEDYVDGYILALEQRRIAFGKVIKERLQ